MSVMNPPPPPRLALPIPAAAARGPVEPARRPARQLQAVLCVVLVFALLLGAPAAPALAEEARWQWPLDPPHQVLVPFDPPAHRYGAGHRGVDLAVPAAPTPVRAVEAGTVRFSGTVAGRGVVSVVHADGLISTYEPVDGVLEAGVPVQAGTVIGTVEDRPELAHCPAATCLHLGARHGEDYLDPMLLLGLRGPSVLLPWAGGPVSSGAAGHSPRSDRRSQRTADSAPNAEVSAPNAEARRPTAGPAHVPLGIMSHRAMSRAVLR